MGQLGVFIEQARAGYVLDGAHRTTAQGRDCQADVMVRFTEDPPKVPLRVVIARTIPAAGLDLLRDRHTVETGGPDLGEEGLHRLRGGAAGAAAAPPGAGGRG